ncbi:MAG: response regulator transcription factor [Acidimicrobiia bacterium]
MLLLLHSLAPTPCAARYEARGSGGGLLGLVGLISSDQRPKKGHVVTRVARPCARVPSTVVSGGRPIRLLVCDDHQVLADALVMVLERDRDLELVASPIPSPEEAVDVCRQQAPDVVLMDISFEGPVTGLEATRRIKEECPETSVVIMTAHHDDAALMVEAAEAGASGYLSKTRGVDALLAAAKAAAKGEVLFDAVTLTRLLIRVSVERQASRTARSLLDRLTEREREVFGLLREGLRNEDIAERLFISPFKVQTHISDILGKLDVRSKAEAVAFALKHGSG